MPQTQLANHVVTLFSPIRIPIQTKDKAIHVRPHSQATVGDYLNWAL